MNTRRFVQILTALIAALFLAGCATQLTQDEQAALDSERFKRHQSIKGYIASCEAGGHVVFYTGPSYQKLRDPVKHIPFGARLSDYQCVRERAVSRFMDGG